MALRLIKDAGSLARIISTDQLVAHSAMALLRFTVLLFLVASAVLAQTQALNDTDRDADPVGYPPNEESDNYPSNEKPVEYPSHIDYPINENPINETIENSLFHETLSIVPKCAADYPRMDPGRRKSFQNLTPRPGAVCTRADGYFVTTSWLPNRKFVYLYDTCGWMEKQINLPARVLYSAGCVFIGNKLFYADYNGKRILQFTSDGVYQKVFATGQKFLRFTAQGNLLYTTIWPSKQVLAYDINTSNIEYRFETTTAYARGLAFDPTGYLHVSTWGKVIEVFTFKGYKVGQRLYPQLARADGILIDSNHYLIVADRGRKQVFIFNHSGLMTKRMTGFGDPLDVAMGYKCGYLLVGDYARSGVYLL